MRTAARSSSSVHPGQHTDSPVFVCQTEGPTGAAGDFRRYGLVSDGNDDGIWDKWRQLAHACEN
ncbi:hypothetical protein AU187_17575 [Mycobacterium sp. IS-1556]|nr:hypothetical protein AU187_17575 [Mycobacterium sp. IS-1556]